MEVRAAFLLGVLALACPSACRNGQPHRGQLPEWLEVAETNGAGRPATWVEDSDGVVRLAHTSNTGQTYNLLMVREQLTDLELRVRLRADRGEEDQGGGLFWRARGPEDYYVARWNPLEDNLRLYHVLGGKRTQLASADIATDPRAWHDLEVRVEGPQVVIRFDGRERLRFEDHSLAAGGGFGLWTKADAATSFDELVVSGI